MGNITEEGEINMRKHRLTADCECMECSSIDWDAPCPNCGLPQRDCCGCHEGYHTDECYLEVSKLNKFYLGGDDDSGT